MFRKIFEAEEGFTLVELLVTIAILAVLFGIVTLTLSGVGSDAEDAVKIAECAVVQSALDIWLAADTTHTISDRVGGAAIIDTGDATFADEYIRDLPTSYTYDWSSDGDVTCPDLP
jgi:prepilin-type N-terminal cleavage/methylation domain-containing protein